VIDYFFSEIKDSQTESIKTLLDFMCRENKIYKERQNYKIYFNKERIFTKHNRFVYFRIKEIPIFLWKSLFK
jgi:hypothetical protein